MNNLQQLNQRYSNYCTMLFCHFKAARRHNKQLLVAALACTALLISPELAHALPNTEIDGFIECPIKNAVARLFMLIEGAFGALIMVVAGLGAIAAASMGAYRAAVGMLVVAVGAFILRSLVSLFFGSFPFETCGEVASIVLSNVPILG